MTVVNYRYMNNAPATDREMLEHYNWLSSFGPNDYSNSKGKISEQPPPIGYKNYHVVDVLGDEFVWMNATFPKEKFTWYIWFESVFLVPDEMISFLRLRWS